MKQDVLDILAAHRLMSIATVRPDGWPQSTIVGYANEDLLIYFMISRAGQKFANMANDNRVSISVASDVDDLTQIRGLSMSALVYPVRDADQLRHGYELMVRRRPAYGTLPEPDWTLAVMMRAMPRDISIVNFAKGLGHADVVRVGTSSHAVTMDPARPDDWGPTPRHN